MAQTISAQRGNVSIAHNTSVTLFTNSASGSSRVIINTVGLFSTSSDHANWASALYLGNAGGGNNIPFAINRTSYGPNYAQIYVPGTIPVPSINNTNGLGMIAHVNNSSVNNTDPNSMLWNWTSANISVQHAWCPKSIWMGPSDNLIFRQFNNNAQTCTLVYNFTVITET